MLWHHPLLDPETTREHLVDHVFITCGNVITEQAMALLIEHLGKEPRSHTVFMDVKEFRASSVRLFRSEVKG